MAQSRSGQRMPAMTEGATVTPLELFFDLVFVFALTQVTEVMAHPDATWGGVARGMLMLALLWWCWCCFAWLGNTVRADEGPTRLALFGVMATMFVAALTIPEAFDDLPGGLSAPLVFVGCYVVVRTLHLVVYWHAAGADRALRRQVLRAAMPAFAGASLLTVAAAVPETRPGFMTLRTGLWAAALAVDYLGIYLIGARRWQVRSASHWTERHGLIIIVALGESIVSIGVGVSALPISWPIVIGGVLGIAVAAALWATYFDVTAPAAEHRMAQTSGVARAAFARNRYTYLHLPMIAGVILLSLGLKKVLNYAGTHPLGDPLKGVGLVVLFGGVVLYLLALVGFDLRLGRWQVRRLVAAALLVALIPLAAKLPALVSLGLLTAVCLGLVSAERARRGVDHHPAGPA